MGIRGRVRLRGKVPVQLLGKHICPATPKEACFIGKTGNGVKNGYLV